MVYKLIIVRVDSFAVRKLDLLIGDNIVGRGVATGHVDEEIAEKAVTINLAPNGEMTMTPSLQVGRAVPIRSGDVCSLVPDNSWFKVTCDESGAMEDYNDVAGKRKAANSTDEEPPEKKLRSVGESVETIYSQSRSVLDDWDTEAVVPEEAEDHRALSSAKDVIDESSAVRDTDSSSAPNGSSSVEVIPTDAKSAGSTAVATTAETSASSVDETSATETSSRNRDETGKKIKWDCGRHFSDQTDQRRSSEAAEDPGEASAPTEENRTAAAETSAPTDEPPRNKCTYGSQCYRRNSEHRIRFSHPGDADYDVPDTRPECPYGVRCYRKNPQHKRDFKHTKNRRSRAQTPVRARPPDDASGNEQSSAEESVDESEYEPSLYDGTSDDYFSEYDDKSDFDATSDCDEK